MARCGQCRLWPSTSSSSSTGDGMFSPPCPGTLVPRDGTVIGRPWPSTSSLSMNRARGLLRLERAVPWKTHVLLHRAGPLVSIGQPVDADGDTVRHGRVDAKAHARPSALSRSRHPPCAQAWRRRPRSEPGAAGSRPRVAACAGRAAIPGPRQRGVGGRQTGSGADERSAWTRAGAGSPAPPWSPGARSDGTSSSVESSAATTSAVRRLPVSAAISPKKSPAPIVDRPR